MKRLLLLAILLFDLLSTAYSQTSEEQNTKSTEPYQRVRLGISVGPGYLISSTKIAEENMVSLGFTADKAKSYYRGMKSGRYANVDLTYQVAPRYGVGIKYKFFDTSGSIEGFFDPHDGVNMIYSTYGDHIYVNFMGATLLYQQFIGYTNKFKLNSSCSIGLADYRNEAEYLAGYYLLTGKNAGMDLSLETEYFLTPHLSVGAGLSCFYSTIRKIKITDGTTTETVDLEKENYENLSRIDISLGIRLYIWEK